MDKTVTDIELAKAISLNVREAYAIAIEFINSNPDYSLVKFREIVSEVIGLVAQKHEITFNQETLADRIRVLAESRLLSYPLKQALHEVRKLGNSGAHGEGNFEGAKEFQENRKRKLIEDAHRARTQIVSILEDVHQLLKGRLIGGRVELSEEGQQDLRQTLYEAYTSTKAKAKLKGGIICETMVIDESYNSDLLVSHAFSAHLEQLKDHSISFYQASCEISASIESHMHRDIGVEGIIQRYADVEALFRYARMVIEKTVETEAGIDPRALARLKAAADRGHGPAEALYGSVLFELKEYQGCLEYSERGAQKEEALALNTLFFAYSTGTGVEQDTDQSLAYLDRAIKLGCPDSVAMLGVGYHRGDILPKDDEKAEELLKQSIDMGSVHGKRYYMVEFNDLAGKVRAEFEKIAEAAQKIMEERKPKPFVHGQPKVGRNDPCPCGSGLKYKKCCGRNN